MNPDTPSPTDSPKRKDALTLKVFGIGDTGVRVLDRLAAGVLPKASLVSINTEPMPGSSAAEKLVLETRLLRGLGSGGDPERGRTLAEEHSAQVEALCEGMDVVFLVTGLGGGAGTGISPVVARAAKAAGALVLVFVTTPFDCEGNRRQHLALRALEEIRQIADGVVCLANQNVFKLVEPTTSVTSTFALTNGLLADGVAALWRLLSRKGLLEIHWEQVCGLLRNQHIESALAVVQAQGPTRAAQVIEKLLAHPLLEGGQTLEDSAAVLVNLTGGGDLTMVEVDLVMKAIQAKCDGAQVLVGAAIEEGLHDFLSVTVVAARSTKDAPVSPVGRETKPAFDTQFLSRAAEPRPGSRFVPPPPVLPPEKMEQMLARQGRGKKTSPKMRQGQLPLEILSKGRFDKSEPTIHKGEDLDVPTYIRRGVVLN
jgi:cell division protein FtsZ